MDSTDHPDGDYTLQWQYEPHVAEEHLGSQKYTTIPRAVGELVANAFDARASEVRIDVALNELGGVDRLVVQDDGVGMNSGVLESRFVRVGVRPTEKNDAVRLGRFGVGRLAVHRIGTVSEWVTTARHDGKLVRSTFRLQKGETGPLRVRRESLDTGKTGTTITVYNLLDSEAPTGVALAGDLLGQFCAYLLANPARKLFVNGEPIDVLALVEQRERELVDANGTEATVDHLLLKKSVEASRFPQQVIFSGKGRTVATQQPERTPSSNYLGIVECAYLDQIVSSNRESLIEMDGTFARLKQAVAERVELYRQRLQAEDRKRFIDRAREEDYYPFRAATSDPITTVKQAVYDAMLEGINQHANIEGLTRKQKTVIFRLLNRAMANENLVEVLDEVASLTDDSIKELRDVLKRTTLESLIRLSTEITTRLHFLDVLHDLVYGAPSKHLKERTQLHHILEPHAWLFGPQFHLATSDKSFREVIRRHRDLAKLPPAAEPDMEKVSGLKDIPDLFLASRKAYPVKPKNHHLLVEIKAPRVKLGAKEHGQVARYAKTVSESQEFDKTTTRWDLFLVSAEVSDELDLQRNQNHLPPGVITDAPTLRVWVVTWAELIQRAREELHLAQSHLQRKSSELQTTEFLKEKFPAIHGQMEAKAPEAPDEGSGRTSVATS
jgi:hypothetical protein